VTDFDRATLRKVAWRFLPFLILAYIVNYLDRTALSVAALTMNQDLGFTSRQFGFAAGMFFVGYCLFEVPSNLALYRYGARVWLTRIMITWGLASAATALVVGPNSFYLIRFLLGVAEAGFFPGVAYFLSTWFPRAYRARILAWFLLGIPASSLVGSPIAGMLLELNGTWGIAGWKWLFILTSAPAILLGVMLPFFLSNRPEEAKWLTPDERAAVLSLLEGEKTEQSQMSHHATGLKAAFTDIRVLILAACQFGLIVGSYGIGVWLPLIIKTKEISNLHVSFISAIPYLFATFVPIIWAAYSDKKDNKVNSVVIGCLVAAAGLMLSMQAQTLSVGLIGITLALIGINTARAIFWAIPTRFLSGVASAGGLAMINSVGTVGGFVGPSMIGMLKDATGSFHAGLFGMAIFLILSALLAGSLHYFNRQP
jgi:ACS family tartrate transporter-like MFS transporter